jgi:hypothetical protein
MSEKREFLVVYDYGMGGLWGIILARSEQEITKEYPELSIVETRPAWMDEALFQEIADIETHDIDGAPWGILNAILTDRNNRTSRS